jgi:hypothetical protein
MVSSESRRFCASDLPAPGTRRTLAWFPEGANPRDVNLSVVVTNVSVEFTKLGSFGTGKPPLGAELSQGGQALS